MWLLMKFRKCACLVCACVRNANLDNANGHVHSTAPTRSQLHRQRTLRNYRVDRSQEQETLTFFGLGSSSTGYHFWAFSLGIVRWPFPNFFVCSVADILAVVTKTWTSLFRVVDGAREEVVARVVKSDLAAPDAL